MLRSFCNLVPKIAPLLLEELEQRKISPCVDQLAKCRDSPFAVEVQNQLLNTKVPSFGITAFSARL